MFAFGRHLIDQISDWPNPHGFTKGVRFVCLNRYIQVDQKPFGQSKIRSIRVLWEKIGLLFISTSCHTGSVVLEMNIRWSELLQLEVDLKRSLWWCSYGIVVTQFSADHKLFSFLLIRSDNGARALFCWVELSYLRLDFLPQMVTETKLRHLLIMCLQ